MDDTTSVGVVRPPPESRNERGKLMKPEPEPESDSDPATDVESSESSSESEEEPEPESESEEDVEYESDMDRDWWKSIPVKELKISDFQKRYDDLPGPYTFGCGNFVYRNKAQVKIDEEEENAIAEYMAKAKNISPFDAIPVPQVRSTVCNNWPKPIRISKYNRASLIQLSKLALDKFHSENQGSKYEFHGLVKATRSPIPRGTYYITFKAKIAGDSSNTRATIFQAHVCENKCCIEGLNVVESCCIKV